MVQKKLSQTEMAIILYNNNKAQQPLTPRIDISGASIVYVVNVTLQYSATQLYVQITLCSNDLIKKQS